MRSRKEFDFRSSATFEEERRDTLVTIVAAIRSRYDLTEDDLAHMRKVNGYVKRHLAQRPDGDVTETAWRYSLMNWGHDPEK